MATTKKKVQAKKEVRTETDSIRELIKELEGTLPMFETPEWQKYISLMRKRLDDTTIKIMNVKKQEDFHDFQFLRGVYATYLSIIDGKADIDRELQFQQSKIDRRTAEDAPLTPYEDEIPASSGE